MYGERVDTLSAWVEEREKIEDESVHLIALEVDIVGSRKDMD